MAPLLAQLRSLLVLGLMFLLVTPLATAQQGQGDALAQLQALARANAQLYRWPDEGTVAFEIRDSNTEAAIAEARAGAMLDRRLADGLAILEGVRLRGSCALASGAVEVEVESAVAITDQARADGLQGVRQGAAEMLTGMLAILDVHRRGLKEGRIVWETREEDGVVVVTMDERGTRTVLRIDPRTDRVLAEQATAQGTTMTVSFTAWQEVEGKLLLRGMSSSLADGTPFAEIGIEWGQVGELWFPTVLHATRQGVTTSLHLEQPRLLP
jgi:hypothetical protein